MTWPQIPDPRWPGAGPDPAGPPDPAHDSAPGHLGEDRSYGDPDAPEAPEVLARSEDTAGKREAIARLRDEARNTMTDSSLQAGSLGLAGEDDAGGPSPLEAALAASYGPPPRPVNWCDLDSVEAEQEWLELNAWVHWVRSDFGLPAAVIPPCWHLHPELVWELSALRSAWVQSYDPQQNASGPLNWLTQFAVARDRLRIWVQTAGCKIDRHRTTRTATWPGEADRNDPAEYRLDDRESEFVEFVLYDTKEREKNETDLADAEGDSAQEGQG